MTERTKSIIGWAVDLAIVAGTGSATYAGWLGAEVTAPIIVGVVAARLPARSNAIATVLGPIIGRALSLLARKR